MKKKTLINATKSIVAIIMLFIVFFEKLFLTLHQLTKLDSPKMSD